MAVDDWRLTVRFSTAPSRSRLRQIADAVNVDSSGYPDGDQARLHASSESEARALLALAAHDGAEFLSLEQWDDEDEIWVLRAGDGQDRSAPRPTAVRRRHLNPRVALIVIAGSLIAGVFFYFIPGSAGSPNAGPHHDLGRAIALTVVLAVVAVGYTVFRS